MKDQPNKQDNLKAIKAQLLRGWRISVISVLQSINTIELRHYITILRRDPELNIGSEWVTRNGKRFKEYFLIKEQKAA